MYSKVFLNNPKNFIKQKVLRIFFTPRNTPPKVKNSKMSLKVIFLGHPVYGINKKGFLMSLNTFNFIHNVLYYLTLAGV